MADLAGLHPLLGTQAAQSVHANDDGGGAGGLALAVAGRGCRSGAGCESAVSIDVGSSVDKTIGSAFHGRRVTIGTATGVVAAGIGTLAHQLRFAVGHWSVIISVTDRSAGISDATLIRIARGMTFAASTRDTASWFDLNSAVPR